MPYKDPERAKARYREYYYEHREKRLADAKRLGELYYKKNAEKIRARHREYMRTNYSKMKQIRAAWRRANPQKSRLYLTRWLERHPGYTTTNNANYRARLRGSAGKHTVAEWESRKEEFGYRCAYCGLAKKLTRDHVVPLISGGSNDIGNIVPACLSCNSRKSRKTAEEFRCVAV